MIKFNRSPLVIDAVTAGATGGITLLASVIMIKLVASYGETFAIGTIASYTLGISTVVWKISTNHSFERLGAANIVTIARFALSCLLAGLASELILSDAHLPVSMAWLFFGIAAFGAALDGLDGFLARRLGTESAFGARFDMEVDAFQILCLAVIAASMHKVGWWVLLSGLLRYAFLVAAFAYPALNGQLFPSWRRKIAAVVQNCVLISLILPGVVQPESSYAAALALALLAYSFSVDVLWLALKAPPLPTRST